MKKLSALLLLALASVSFRVFDANYFALSVNFTQDWSNAGVITANDDWSGVASIEGYYGRDITTSTSANPQTLLGVSAIAGDNDVIANQSNPNTNTSGAVAEFDGIANPTIALQGSGTADAPYIVLYLNTTGATNIRLQYNVRDIDGSADNAIQQLALQYRSGNVGNFTNIPEGYIADATTGPNLADLVTPVSVILPAACENQAEVQIRMITANAPGSDEWIGIDDIVVTPNSPATTVSISGGGSIAEAGPGTSLTLNFSPATSGSTTVDFDLTAGTATLTTDYTIDVTGGSPASINTTTGTITVPAGTTDVTLDVTPVNDASQELTESVSFTISNPGGGYVLGTTNSVVNITDDDIDPINYTGAVYTQDFNTLASAGGSTITPTGWLFSESGTNANASYNTGNGGGNGGDTYSFGTDASDRAFGGLRSGSLTPTVGAKVQNNTGATISSLQIAYRGEQWRLGSTGRNDRLDFQISLNATSLTTGTWTDIDGLDFIGPLSSGGTGAKDGNDPTNYQEYTFTINGLSIPAGNVFYIRWLDQDAAGADDGLAIDDFSLAPGCTPPSNQPTLLNLVPSLTSISGSFTAADPGTTAADAYLVLVSTSPALTEQPVNGTAYAIDDLIGDATVISINGSTVFNAESLTPSTTYYFFVYSNSSATNCYNLINPLQGNIATTSPPVCTPPALQASSLSATNVTGTSMDLNYTRGDGDNVLIVARVGSAVDAAPFNGVTYTAGSTIGTGNVVIYNGNASIFNYGSLSANTTYHFALFEYSTAIPCYTVTPLTGNFTTACVDPVNVTGLSPSPQDGAVTLSWTNPTLSCFDEVLVIVSTAPITSAGGTFIGAGNPVYGGGEQVVFRGLGSTVTVTGLTNGTNYFFKVFTRNSGNYSSGVQTTAVPFNPATGFQYLYGNLHAHSSYSDGNADDPSKIPADDYAFARDADCMDFLGISEHNHATAGLTISNYALGQAQADAINGVTGTSGNSIVTLWGMEWGTISSGGHMLIYGFDDQVIGWEPGNYDIFCEKGDYNTLLALINNQPNAFATLAHPGSSDYGNILGSAYSASKDDAIVASAIESGPAFSTSTTYNDFPSSLAYLSYYRSMLAKGYRIGATVDQDNHNMTFGTANSNRLVVLSPAKTRTELVNALRNMRFYASQDCNVQVDYKIGSSVVGSSVVSAGLPTITLTVADVDGENVSTIELWGGEVGGSVPVSALRTYAGVNTFTFTNADIENVQLNNTTYYYYLIITQNDGNKIVTSPIWYSRSDGTLPVTFMNVQADYNKTTKKAIVSWATAQEMNSSHFVVERSLDGGATWSDIGTIQAAGSSSTFRQYSFIDEHPKEGIMVYRIRQVDIDDRFMYSKAVSVRVDGKEVLFTVNPNPASGSTLIYSNISSAGKASIELRDAQGRMVRKAHTVLNANAAYRFDLSGVNTGVYFLSVNIEEKKAVQEVIVH